MKKDESCSKHQYQCQKCQKKYTRQKAFNDHVTKCNGNKSKESIPSPIKEATWRNTMGNILDGKCPVCMQHDISPWNYECGHIISEHAGGSATTTNLRAICNKCNKSMGTKNMEVYMSTIWAGREYPKDRVKPYENVETKQSVININSTGQIYTSIIKIEPNADIAGIYEQFYKFFKEKYTPPRGSYPCTVESIEGTYICQLESFQKGVINVDSTNSAINTLYNLMNTQGNNTTPWSFTVRRKFDELLQIFQEKCSIYNNTKK